ncbi:MAG TPA: CheR family methyltransferase [Vicinamibacterales bacterium]|nr:CheR family methyltransferase [Vicinamibacterales bacterium]
MASVSDARALIERRHDLLPAVLSTLLIGVTEFFRDPQVFDGIRAVALPALAGRRWPPRVWSAGCSSGAELYTVAILLDEAGLLDGATLLGTDCRDEAIAEARVSTYRPPVSQTLPPAYAARYFRACGPEALRPVRRLRAAASWKVADLHAAAEEGPWDLVLWRNAAIYLEPDVAGRICRRLVDTIAPGGFLVVGKAERPPADLGLVHAGRCLHRKPGGTDAS